MPTIESCRLLADGSLEVTMVSRTVVVVPAAEVQKPNKRPKGKGDVLAAIKKAVRVR